MTFNDFLTEVNNIMYTYILIVLLLGTGIYFTIRTKGVQFRLLKDGIKSLLEKPEGQEDSVSSFQALMISTASRVGTGNIAGIATAIAAGGSGAVFWMWVTALIGGASAFIESTLAQVYKVRQNGQFRGGPSYYMERALGKRWMGIIFSVLLIICFAYGFNGLQAYNMSSALEYYVVDYSDTVFPMIFGIILAVATGFVIWGGVHRIGFMTSVIVPVMALIYIFIGLVTMVLHITELPAMFAGILKNALDVQAIMGGFAGSAVVIGIKRGLFSNEAGMGSAPNASASAEVEHPVKQGLVQIISVFIDTLLICSSTAMMLLVSGVEGVSGKLDGIPFVQKAISANVGNWGIHFITFSIFAFAFSSVIGNYYYAESNILFIRNNKMLLYVFRITCVVAVFLGAQADFGLVWNIADVTMGLMAIVNIVAILLLGKVALKVLKDYEWQKKEGKSPVFFEKNVGLSGTVWTEEKEKVLYVSDLDGTLLNENQALSEYTIKTLNALQKEKGILFTYATARSIHSAQIVTKGLEVNLPVITNNGTFIVDPVTKKNLVSEKFDKEALDVIVTQMERLKMQPFVYSFIDGKDRFSWVTGEEGEGMKRYLKAREADVRKRKLTNRENLYDGDVYYFTCIGTKENLEPLYESLKEDERFHILLQKEIYANEYWCEIMPKKATKAQGLKTLKTLVDYDKIVCFGDAKNDILMFEEADECYAVENAVEELKKVATGVIGSNLEDGVAKFLSKQ